MWCWVNIVCSIGNMLCLFYKWWYWWNFVINCFYLFLLLFSVFSLLVVNVNRFEVMVVCNKCLFFGCYIVSSKCLIFCVILLVNMLLWLERYILVIFCWLSVLCIMCVLLLVCISIVRLFVLIVLLWWNVVVLEVEVVKMCWICVVYVLVICV